MFLTGGTIPGTYQFQLTVTNSCGTHTTPTLTYNFTGTRPRFVNFQPAGHGAPEQLTIYSNAGTGGEVHCSRQGRYYKSGNILFQYRSCRSRNCSYYSYKQEHYTAGRSAHHRIVWRRHTRQNGYCYTTCRRLAGRNLFLFRKHFNGSL